MDWLVPTSVATNYITNGDGVIQDVLYPIVFGGGEEAACLVDWDEIAENLGSRMRIWNQCVAR